MWYKKEIFRFLNNEKKKLIYSAIFVLIFSLLITSYNTYEWIHLEIIEVPPYLKSLLSALVFVSLGSLLYSLKVYKYLYYIFVTILNNQKLYKKIKNIMSTQKELELTKEDDENIMNIIFQYSSKKDSFQYLKSIVRNYLDTNTDFSTNVFLHSFNFDENPINDMIYLEDNNTILNKSFIDILNQ